MRGIKVTRVLAERPIDPLALPKMSFFLLRNLVFDVAFKMCHAAEKLPLIFSSFRDPRFSRWRHCPPWRLRRSFV